MNTAIYNFNNLPFYSEQELLLKEYLVKTITLELKQILKQQNRAWDMVQIEAPCLIPRSLINQNYTNDDLWVQESQSSSTELVLKPETTPSTYAYILKDVEHQQFYPPICYYQVSNHSAVNKINHQNIVDSKSFIS